jgi:hypothetical protein
MKSRYVNKDKNIRVKNLKKNVRNIKNIRNKKTRKNSNYSDPNAIFNQSQILTNNFESVDNILNSNFSEQTYLSQFEPMCFDNVGCPSAFNDIHQSRDPYKMADLKEQISNNEGWSVFSNTNTDSLLGVLSKSEIMKSHSKIMPYFRMHGTYGENSASMDYKRQLFTGYSNEPDAEINWKKKKENSTLFEPSKENIHHMPSISDYKQNRIYASRTMNGFKPFDEIRVTPGLNLSSGDDSNQGYNAGLATRILDKNVDELRIKPKISHTLRPIDGLKGVKRPVAGKTIKRRPEKTVENFTDDLLPTASLNHAPKVKDNIRIKDQNRNFQNIEYTGGAHTKEGALDKNVPEYMKEKYKKSTKQNFLNPTKTNKYSHDATKFNPNTDSYLVAQNPTLKDLTSDNNRIGTIGNNFNKTTARSSDNARKTNTETLSQSNFLMLNKTNDMRSVVHNVNPADTTMKQTTINTSDITGLFSNCGTYAPVSSHINTTTCDTTCVLPHNTFIDIAVNAPTSSLFDIAKTTNTDTTTGLNRNLFISDTLKKGYVHSITTAKNKFSDVNNDDPNICNGAIRKLVSNGQTRPNVMKTKLIETIDTPDSLFINATNYQSYVKPDDVAKTTLSEINNSTDFVKAGQNIGSVVRPSDQLRNTGRSGLTNANINTNVNTGIKFGSVRSNDIAQTTNKQTINTNNNLIINPNKNGSQVFYNDSGLATMLRETLDPISTMFVQTNAKSGQTRIDNISDPTIRQTYDSTNYFTVQPNSSMTSFNPDTGYSERKSNMRNILSSIDNLNYQDNFKKGPNSDITVATTMADLNIESYQTPIIQPSVSKYAVNSTYSVDPTLRDTLIHRSSNTNINSKENRGPINLTANSFTKQPNSIDDNHSHGIINNGNTRGPTGVSNMSARITNRQLNSENNIVSNISSSHKKGQFIPQSFMFDNTTKQTTINNNHSGFNSSSVKKGQISNDNAKITTKDTLLSPINTMITGNEYKSTVPIDQQCRVTNNELISNNTNGGTNISCGKRGQVFIADSLRTTINDTLVGTNNNIIGINNKNVGNATQSYSRDPLKTTKRELMCDNHHIVSVKSDVSKGQSQLFDNTRVTNKELGIENNYIGPLLGERREKTRTTNYKLNDKKAQLSQAEYRPPTDSNVNMGPNPDHVNIRQIDDNNVMPQTSNIYINKSAPRMHQIKESKINNSNSKRFIDPSLLSQLETNPYNIKISSCIV